MDCLNGEANGKGKMYDEKGELIFEGEYSNNERNGKGKLYNEKGELIFEGEYLDGYRIKGKRIFKWKIRIRRRIFIWEKI